MTERLVTHRRFLHAAAAALLLAAFAGVTAAHAQPPAALPAPLADSADTDAMLQLETPIDDALQQGHVVPVHFPSTDQLPGTADATAAWGDSGLWTGVYLGGEAMRYAVARRYLHSPNSKASD